MGSPLTRTPASAASSQTQSDGSARRRRIAGQLSARRCSRDDAAQQGQWAVSHATDSEIDTRIDELARELSNWGRWGDKDEVGTLNLITPKKRLQAAACVRSGTIHSLGLELRADLPQPPGSGRLNPQHVMTETGSDAA